MHHFSLTDLAVLSAVADEKNLTRGAQRVHIGPSSASARIKNLEEALGVKLLVRKVRGVELTPAGELVTGVARNIHREIEQLRESLLPFVRKEMGVIRIVANYGASVDYLPKSIAAFLSTHPDISIQLEQHSSDSIVACVAEDRADIGIGAYVGDYPGVTFHSYREDELVVIAHKSHPLACRRSVAFSEILDYEFVCLDTSAPMQSFIFDKAKNCGKKIVPRLQVAGQPQLLSLVEENVGIAVLSRAAVAATRTEHIQVITLTDPWAKRHLRVAVPSDETRQSRWVKPLVEILCGDTPVQ